MGSFELAQTIVASSLQLKPEELEADTELLGNFPEFNSLTLVSMISLIEENLDCEIDDNEIDTELFRTVGSLAKFIESKQ